MTKTRRGYILVQALIVIAGLLALMAMLAADQRASNQDVQLRLRQRRADAAGDAALARALAAVQSANPNLVTFSDGWARLGDSGGEEFDLDGAAFRVQIIDAGSRVDVNSAPPEQMERLPLTQDQIHALLDWREPKRQARPDGAKDSYYNALPTPYNANLGPLATVDELLLVKNWTAQTLYGPPTLAADSQMLPDADGNALPLASMLAVDGGAANARADGQPRLNLGRPGADPAALAKAGLRPELAMKIAAQSPFTSFRALFAIPDMTPDAIGPLLDAVTFTDKPRLTGNVNVNTAPQAVLRTLPGITPALAAAIAARQADGFHSLSDLATLPGMDPARLAQIADRFTVGSDTWIVRAHGRSGGMGTALEAVIGLRNGRAQILTRTRLNTTGIPAWWGWTTEPTSTGDAGDAR